MEGFRAAARQVADRAPQPKSSRKTRRGRASGGGMVTTRAVAADYVKLCRDPVADLRRWIEEDRKARGARRDEPTTTKGGQLVRTETHQTDAVARAVGVRGKPLHEMRGWVDAPIEERDLSGRMSARPRSGAAGDGELRPLRGEGGAGLAAGAASVRADIAAAFRIEHAAIVSFYAARIEAVKRGVAAAAITAAIRALVDEQIVALRALADRRGAAERNEQDKQAARPEISLRRVRGCHGLR